MIKRMMRMSFLIIMLSSLVGCWDAQDIEDISMAIGYGYDLGQSDGDIMTTFQVINTKAKQQASPYINLHEENPSFHGAIRDESLQANVINAKHLESIIIHKDLAEKLAVNKYLSQVVKSNEARRSSLVFISNEPAQQILSSGLDQVIPAQHLKKLNASNYSIKRLPAMTLGQLSARLQGEETFAVPAVRLKDGVQKLGGAYVIEGRSRKVVGYLDDYQVIGLNFLLGNEIDGIVVKGDSDQQVMEIHHTDITPELTFENGHFKADFYVELKARLSEDWATEKDWNAFEEGYLEDVQNEFEKEIKGRMEKTATFLQEDLQADAMDLHKLAKIHHYQEWKKVKDVWDEGIFPHIPIDIKVKITITEFGTKGGF
ncbi:Ger(x)C family spore germination protein [Bacillaceae bacterium SIJ1]|uniref:Ger(x)C family spore germination protein n=1 Tax=Litoribacterium kuwaitense TaxID=1398745 RepID=UPI0013EDFCF4|nr:Ger(x)C family spore germination protein [Litoribacterium kuwaitense]NGP45059.1 Ger(x)C family spore germination protein [Litoribacterium kuwaitense]